MTHRGLVRVGIHRTRALVVLAMLAAPGMARAESPPHACGKLMRGDFSHEVGASVRMARADYVAGAGQPAYCEVSAVIAPAVRVVMRLPASRWSGRLLVAGCGGLCGSLHIESADDALGRGYVTATTDMGHDAEAGPAWRSDPAALEDFTHRATHLTTVFAKAVVLAYYGRGQKRAYFRGCSTGGRQGLMEALRHPDDFDGIIAGAPASFPTVQIQLWDRQINRGPHDRELLGQAEFELLRRAALEDCDAADGLRDGLISNPLGCRFDPGRLACGGATGGGAGGPAGCLTPEQVDGARGFYAGPRSGSTRLTTLGMAPGSESGVAANIVSIGDRPPAVDAVLANFAQIVLGAGADWRDLKIDGTVGRENPTDGIPEASAAAGALVPFASRGGKLLMYAGWIDPLVSPTVSIDFHRRMSDGLGAANAASLRLFMLPGVGHCRGGDGPDSVDWLTAIEAWVETGRAPQRLTSYKLRPDPAAPADTRFPPSPDRIVLRRPIFPFPGYARFSGRGASTDPASFESADPPPNRLD